MLIKVPSDGRQCNRSLIQHHTVQHSFREVLNRTVFSAPAIRLAREWKAMVTLAFSFNYFCISFVLLFIVVYLVTESRACLWSCARILDCRCVYKRSWILTVREKGV